MSVPIEGRYSVATTERIRYAGLASMNDGGLEIVFGLIYLFKGFTLLPITEFEQP